MRSHQDDDVMDHQLLVPGRARRKGKGKAVEGADSDLELDEPFTPPSEVDSDNGRGVASYPPTTEEEEESRRVEEVGTSFIGCCFFPFILCLLEACSHFRLFNTHLPKPYIVAFSLRMKQTKKN